MYKKRFAKWGFQKNTRRSAAAVSPSSTKDQCSQVAKRGTGLSAELESLPASPALGQQDTLMLIFLSSVRLYSTAFFESVPSHATSLAPFRRQPASYHLRPEQTEEASFTFKLVIELLSRGQGNLAGRMARKAFLLVEDMLTLDGPVMVWNLLQMMHEVIVLRHMQLFRMMLAHLLALVDGRIPTTHPLHAMLYGLRGLVASLASATSTPSSSFATSPLPSPSQSSLTSSDTDESENDVWLLSQSLSSWLEQAWSLNAQILFNHFDYRLFQLYFRIHYDSCSIRPPTVIFDTAKQWLSDTEEEQYTSKAAANTYGADNLFEFTSIEDDIFQELLVLRKDVSPPRSYEMLHSNTIAALREKGNSMLCKTFNSGDTAILLRIVAGLVTARILEEWPAAFARLGVAGDATTQVSRFHASNLASTIRTLTDLDTERVGGGLWQSSEIVERTRYIVALREYAHGETCPRVVREMWQLEDALVAAGELEEAQEVGQNAFRRLEEYMKDIPVCSV